jgi:hypothetical protein
MANAIRGNSKLSVAEFSGGTSALNGHTSFFAKQGSVTEALRDIAGVKAAQPWIPFWCLTEQGGMLEWNADLRRHGFGVPPPVYGKLKVMGCQSFAPTMHSWLYPGDAGCGIFLVKRFED